MNEWIYRGQFPNRRYSAIGGKTRRSIMDRNQIFQTLIFEIVIVYVYELTLFLMFLYGNSMKVLLLVYTVKAGVYTLHRQTSQGYFM